MAVAYSFDDFGVSINLDGALTGNTCVCTSVCVSVDVVSDMVFIFIMFSVLGVDSHAIDHAIFHPALWFCYYQAARCLKLFACFISLFALHIRVFVCICFAFKK